MNALITSLGAIKTSSRLKLVRVYWHLSISSSLIQHRYYLLWPPTEPNYSSESIAEINSRHHARLELDTASRISPLSDSGCTAKRSIIEIFPERNDPDISGMIITFDFCRLQLAGKYSIR